MLERLPNSRARWRIKGYANRTQQYAEYPRASRENTRLVGDSPKYDEEQRGKGSDTDDDYGGIHGHLHWPEWQRRASNVLLSNE